LGCAVTRTAHSGRRHKPRRGIALALILGQLAAGCGGSGNDDKGGNATVTRGGMFRTATTDLGFTNGFDPTGEYSARGFNLSADPLGTSCTRPCPSRRTAV
jgi:hypothetical protein